MGDFPWTSKGMPYEPNANPPVPPQYDNVHVFTLGANGTTWAPAAATVLPGPELLLGHSGGGVGLPVPSSVSEATVMQRELTYSRAPPASLFPPMAKRWWWPITTTTR